MCLTVCLEPDLINKQVFAKGATLYIYIVSGPEQLLKSSCPSLGLSVCPSVCRLVTFVKKWALEYQIVTKIYIPSNLCHSSDSSDSSDSSNSCDSFDSSDSSDSSNSSDSSESSTEVTVVTKKHLFTKNLFFTNFFFFSQIFLFKKKKNLRNLFYKRKCQKKNN